ncbi:MAG: hypothetical protein B7Y99_03080 [Caulobacterales bacterium 32-69-10]|nr:MAG: hypothetical protein B7Y99_03080 [Caulobacterales bacterium 32-69-10]
MTRLIVKVEGSDAALIQRASKIVGQLGEEEAPPKPFDRHPDQLEWMRAHGWLAQPDFDFLKFLNHVGAYDRSLLRPKEGASGSAQLDPADEARSLLELLFLQEIELDETEYADVSALAADAKALSRLARDPIVALWTKKKGGVLVVEGSHLDEGGAEGSLDGAIEHSCGPNRLLFVDLRCALGAPPVGEAKAIRVLFARAVAEA